MLSKKSFNYSYEAVLCYHEQYCSCFTVQNVHLSKHRAIWFLFNNCSMFIVNFSKVVRNKNSTRGVANIHVRRVKQTVFKEVTGLIS